MIQLVKDVPEAKISPLRIVLSHNPDSARKLMNFQFDLKLAGHTHGGQIYLPVGESAWKWKRISVLGIVAGLLKFTPKKNQVKRKFLVYVHLFIDLFQASTLSLMLSKI